MQCLMLPLRVDSLRPFYVNKQAVHLVFIQTCISLCTARPAHRRPCRLASLRPSLASALCLALSPSRRSLLHAGRRWTTRIRRRRTSAFIALDPRTSRRRHLRRRPLRLATSHRPTSPGTSVPPSVQWPPSPLGRNLRPSIASPARARTPTPSESASSAPGATNR